MTTLLIPEPELPGFAKRLRSQIAVYRRSVQQQERRLNKAQRTHPGSPRVSQAARDLDYAKGELAKLENDAKAVDGMLEGLEI